MRGIGTSVIGVAPGGTDSNVGAGLPAMVVNDDAESQNVCGAFTFFAGKSAPIG